MDPDQTAQASTLFEGWWEPADHASLEVIARYERIERSPRRGRRENGEGPAFPIPIDDRIRELLLESNGTRGHWMKDAYHRSWRRQSAWWHDGWISDRRRPPYGVGDLIVLYLGGDGSPKRCPAMLEAGNTGGDL